MDGMVEARLRDNLLNRKVKLENAISEVGGASDLERLLGDVDAALERIDQRHYGLCQVCNLAVGEDLLNANPMIQYCLCELTPAKQRALEHDLTLAAQVQKALLPAEDLECAGWKIHYRYIPAGPVSGDYCDVITGEARNHLFFLLGDVSGKGVAAAFFMARLNAIFRSLIGTGLSVAQLFERANEIFCGSTLSTQYATLVCGKASDTGKIELCNAGHCRPLLIHRGHITEIDPTGFPVGIFCNKPYEIQTVDLAPGDTLLLYSDGLSEATDQLDNEYGIDRVARIFMENHEDSPGKIAAAQLRELGKFMSEPDQLDDVTIMVVRRSSNS
ncbi:PP2C family protein-serine/threonine phosphatase [candidate division CSSED10-310 bacterium]|uniref:PP2C family protein-serine/threonine phosphatase n=1 Tax=candidate division CSSED10-310 bacterium TaxID=2855610 RepID=A0ABV6YX78_UNCC1